MRDFRELKVWEKAYNLTLAVYKATASFRRDERYGLTSQIRRSCASIAANIAEGCGRGGEFDLAFLDRKDYEHLASEVTEVKRMLTSFIQKLNADG